MAADPPQIPLNIPDLRAPQSRLSPGEVAAPYEELAKTLDEGGDATNTAAKQLATQAGLTVVARDADGNVQPQRQPIVGDAALYYQQAVKVAEVADGEGQLKRDDIALRQQYRNNPGSYDPKTGLPTGGYLLAADTYRAEKVKQYSDAVGPEIGLTLGKIIDGQTTQTYRGLLNEKERLDLQRADNSITAQIQSSRDDLMTMARGGVTQGKDWDDAIAKVQVLTDQKVANPRLAYTPEQAAFDMQQFHSELSGQGFLYHIDQVYKDPSGGAQPALDAAKSILTDTSLKLSDAQREGFYHKAVAEVRANEASRREDINDAHSAFRELSSAASLGQRIEPEEVDAVRQAYQAAHYPAGVAMVDAAFAHKSLHDDFGRQPIPDQIDQINTLRSAKTFAPTIQTAAQQYGVDPALLTRVIRQESGFNPNVAPSSKGAQGIAQFMPETAARYGVNPADATSSISGAAHYLSDLTKQFGGNQGLAAAGYNWGEGNVTKWLATGADPAKVPVETRQYVQSVTGQPIDDWVAGKGISTPLSGDNPAAASWLLANRSAALNDAATEEWKGIVEDWAAGKGGGPPDQKVYEILNAARMTNNIDLAAHVTRDMHVIDTVRQASVLPLPQQQAIIGELHRQLSAGTADAGTDLVMKQLTAKTEAIQNGLRDNPIQTTVTNFPDRFKTPAPLDPSNPDAFVAGLKQRGQIASFASSNYGVGPRSALDKDEVAQVQGILQTADPASKAKIFSAMDGSLPDAVRSVTLAKLAKGGPDAMTSAAGGALNAEAPDIAASIFRGQQAIKTDKAFLPSKGADKSAFDEKMNTALPSGAFNLAARTDPTGPYAMMRGAVEARYADLSAQAGDTSGKMNDDRLKQSANDVTGGVLSHKGSPLIAPERGMSQDQFDRVLWGVNDKDLAGVTDLRGRPVTADWLRNNAKLEGVGEGRYAVRFDSGAAPTYAVTGAGTGNPQKFILDLRGRKPLVPGPVPSFDPGP